MPRRRQRGSGLRDVRQALKQALKREGKQAIKNILRHKFNRKMGETFLVPSMRPKWSSTSTLVKNELRSSGRRAIRAFRKKPKHHLRRAWQLLRK